MLFLGREVQENTSMKDSVNYNVKFSTIVIGVVTLPRLFIQIATMKK